MATGGNTVVARVGLDDKGFQEGVSKIQRSLKVVQSEFAAASSKMGDFGKSTEGLKLKADSLNKQMELQKAKVAALSKSYQESVEKKGEDAKATENLKIKLNYAIAEMNKMEGELSDINKQIEVQSSGFTKLGKNLEGIGSKMKNIGDGFSRAGKNLSTTVTAPIVAAGTGLLKLASDFEEANNTIRIGTGATGEALESLNEDFKAVYTSVNTNIGDASQVVADLNTRTGLSGQSLQKLSTQMLKLAKITGENINSLIPASTRMFQDAGLGAEEYADALDYTFKVSQSTGIGVSKLQQLMTQFGGPLRQMGFDWQTSAAMLGKFEKEGVNTELVVGSLRIALGKMAKEGISEPNKALAEMITRIKEAGTAGEANAMALEMFGARAGPDMAAAIREGRLNLDELIASIKASPETIEKAAKDTETIADKFAVLKNQMAVALEPLGKRLLDAVDGAMPAIQKLIQGITSIIEKFNDLSPAQQDMILKLALIAAAIGPVLMVIGKLISIGGSLVSTVGSISTALGAAGGSGGALGAVFTALTGPVGMVIAAIAGLAAIFISFYSSSQEFRGVVKVTWEEIKNIITSTFAALKTLFEAFVSLTKQIWRQYGDEIVAIAKSVFELIGNTIKAALNLIQGIIKTTTSLIRGDWAGAWEEIKTWTQSLWSSINTIITGGLTIIKGTINLELQIIKDLVSTAWDLLKTITAGVWQGIRNDIEEPLTKAKDTVKKIVDDILGFFTNLKIPEIKLPKIKLPHFSIKGDFSLNPISVPQLQVNWYNQGGIFTRPSIIGVGEQRPEFVGALEDLRYLIRSELNGVQAGNPATGVNITIQSMNVRNDNDIKSIARELFQINQSASRGKGRW